MKFKPEDFQVDYKQMSATDSLTSEMASEMATAKIKEWLDSSPTVYCHHVGWFQREYPMADSPRYGDTHKAKLVCIEEIQVGKG